MNSIGCIIFKLVKGKTMEKKLKQKNPIISIIILIKVTEA